MATWDEGTEFRAEEANQLVGVAAVDVAEEGGAAAAVVVAWDFGTQLCRLVTPAAEDYTLEWTSWNRPIPAS